MIRTSHFASFCLLILVAGCISGVKPADTYTDSSGVKSVIETDREQCTRSCNQEYSRCMETDPAQSNPVNAPAGMFGASADCRASLKSCLPGCKGR